MRLNDRLIRLATRRHLRRRTLRLRLTALYGGLFLVCGAALLAITYVLVAHATVRPGYVRTVRGAVALPAGHGHLTVPKTLRSTAGQAALTSVIRGQRISDLHQLVIWSGIALAIMAIIAAWLGWIVAGRALRPLRTITATTREISATNLHHRLALQGPEDEVKELGDTIDALLARLEDSFQAQRAFVANASHELRTPLTLSRAMLQFALADPTLTLDSLKATCADALTASAEHEQLLEALLTLSRGQQELEHRDTVDLAATVRDVIQAHSRDAAEQSIRIHTSLRPATVSGDEHLLSRLVTNLFQNAIRHNVSGGQVLVAVEARAEEVTLAVSNTGTHVPAEQIARLLQPFRRLARDRAAESDGHGLGLSIVSAIAAAHQAKLHIEPNPEGGLRVAIAFPQIQRAESDVAARLSSPVDGTDVQPSSV